MHAKNSVDIFHLSLPPFRAALVPWWAMAPRSEREAFSQDSQFPSSNSVGAAPVNCSVHQEAPSSGRKSRWSGFISTLLSDLKRMRACRRCTRNQVFTNNCNPWVWLQWLLATCLYLSKVIIQLKTPWTKQIPSCTFRYARWLDSGFLVWQAGEQSQAAVRSG